MTEYSTVRIDVESKQKLEEIADQIGAGIGVHISKATALKLIINEAHEVQVINPQRLFNDMATKNKEGGNENG